MRMCVNTWRPATHRDRCCTCRIRPSPQTPGYAFRPPQTQRQHIRGECLPWRAEQTIGLLLGGNEILLDSEPMKNPINLRARPSQKDDLLRYWGGLAVVTAWISWKQLPCQGMVCQKLLAVLGYGLAHGGGRRAGRSAGHGLGELYPSSSYKRPPLLLKRAANTALPTLTHASSYRTVKPTHQCENTWPTLLIVEGYEELICNFAVCKIYMLEHFWCW